MSFHRVRGIHTRILGEKKNKCNDLEESLPLDLMPPRSCHPYPLLSTSPHSSNFFLFLFFSLLPQPNRRRRTINDQICQKKLSKHDPIIALMPSTTRFTKKPSSLRIHHHRPPMPSSSAKQTSRMQLNRRPNAITAKIYNRSLIWLLPCQRSEASSSTMTPQP